MLINNWWAVVWFGLLAVESAFLFRVIKIPLPGGYTFVIVVLWLLMALGNYALVEKLDDDIPREYQKVSAIGLSVLLLLIMWYVFDFSLWGDTR